MSQRLASYLQDHLAGARFAIDMLERLRDQRRDRRLASLASDVLLEVEEDRQTLLEVIEQLGERAGAVKEATAWLAEKMAPVKVHLGAKEAFADFLVVEALCLGALGKRSLWRALSQYAPVDGRLAGFDWNRLIDRAESQFERLEAYRLQAAAEVLKP